MSARTVQLVLHYDGAEFSGWQIQPDRRTVQGELERVLAQLCATRIVAQGAGRTDAGVHARGQAVGLVVPDRWNPASLQRAVNALLPRDVWVAAAYEMRPEFHARFSAISRRYSYHIGTDASAWSPFRRSWEWCLPEAVRYPERLDAAASSLLGPHCFRAFAVRGTAPDTDNHVCDIQRAEWERGPGTLTFHVAANRFLHHMVRFLVGTMVDIARDRRSANDIQQLLLAPDNAETSTPAPAHALFLEHVTYPDHLYQPA